MTSHTTRPPFSTEHIVLKENILYVVVAVLFFLTLAMTDSLDAVNDRQPLCRTSPTLEAELDGYNPIGDILCSMSFFSKE